ncbi:NAC domain-containing protein 71 [Rosa sericea]
MGYPIGYRFHPTDEELVGYFLYHRARMGNQFHSNEISEYSEFYGQEEPWVVWDKSGGSSVDDGEPLFFFTKRKKLNPNSKRFDRKVGSGTWSGQFSREVVAEDRDTGCRITGMRREFRYEGGCDPEQNNSWLMQEYELCATDVLVLCTLKKNPRKARPSTSTATTSSAQTNGKKRKRIVDNQPKAVRSEKAETCEEQQSTICVDLTDLEETNSESRDHQLLQAVDQDYHPELHPDLVQSNEHLFFMEELFAPSPLNVQDPLPHLESNESQSQDQSYVRSNDQFQDHSYEDNSFMSFLSTEFQQQLGEDNNLFSSVSSDQYLDCNDLTW